MFTHIHVHPPYLSPNIFFTNKIFHPPYLSPTIFFTHHIFHPPHLSPTIFFTHHIFHSTYFSPHLRARRGGGVFLVSLYLPTYLYNYTILYEGGGKCLNPKISSLYYRGGGSIFDTISQFKLFLQFIITPTLWGGGGEYHFSLSRQVPNFWRSISNLSAFSHYSFYINKPSLARVFYQKSHFKLTSYQLYQKH